MNDFDIAVVGGGIVGLTAALALAHNGYEVAVIEPKLGKPILPESYDPRNFALTKTSIQILENLGVWSELDHSRNGAIKSIAVWDANSSGHLEFSPSLVGERSFGVISENANLLLGLQARLKQQANIEVFERAALNTTLESDHRIITFENGEGIRAKVIVCCDGGNSPMRGHLGIVATPKSYDQRSLVCNVGIAKPHHGVARQIFHDTGPLAFLPLADPHQCAVVWTTSGIICDELMGISAEQFIPRLNAAACRVVEGESLRSERFDFPLCRMHVDTYDAERAVLVGDSAHIIHPLAGQGLNLGIMDAAVLAHVLKVASPIERQTLIQQPKAALRRYSRWRAGDNLLMVIATDSLNKLFRRPESLVRSLRGAGLNTTSKISPLMRLFTLRAMGRAGELPDLARTIGK